jgi:hypothetical protein
MTDSAKLSGLFKEVYIDSGIENLVPEASKLTKRIPFVSANQETGNKFHMPVIVSGEAGITMALNSDGGFELNSPVSMQMQDAQVEGSQFLLRSTLSYEAAARASNSKKAFEKATSLLVENMMESATKRIEVLTLYGQDNLGVCSASSNVSATQTRVTITPATWASGIWCGSENTELNFYSSGGTLISSGADAIFTVLKVDADNRYLYVTGTATGITALDAGISSATISYRGSRTKEFAGLKKIITNTGTLFNISAADYNLWKGNSVTVTGQLTFKKLLSAVSKAVGRGLNESVLVAVNPDTWSDLASDLSALKRFDGSYNQKELENGAENITYYGQNGKIEIMSHNCVKAGDAIGFPPKRVKRVGASDLSFKMPGQGDDIVLHRPEHASYEMRLYTNQAVFVETPARCFYISGFTNS